MNKTVLSLRSTKVLGIILYGMTTLAFLAQVITWLIHGSDDGTLFCLLRIVMMTVSATGLFLGDRKSKVKWLLPTGIILLAVFDIFLFMPNMEVMFPFLAEAAAYIVIAVIIFFGYKHAEVAVIAVFCLLGCNILAKSSLFLFGDWIYRFVFSEIEIFNTASYNDLIFLAVLTILLLSKTDKRFFERKSKASKTVTDLKEQLTFLEQKHKDGQISDEDYKIQRKKMLDLL